jgi:hypothetical protein
MAARITRRHLLVRRLQQARLPVRQTAAGAWAPSVEFEAWPETGRDFAGIFVFDIAPEDVEATAFCGGAEVWA